MLFMGGGIMKNTIKFIALGGGQEVGASCYYLNVDGCNIIFDCGRGVSGKLTYGPDLSCMIQAGMIDDISEIDALLISHSHYDHIGYLPEFRCIAPFVPIYATSQTKALAYYQIWDNENKYDNGCDSEKKACNEIIAEKKSSCNKSYKIFVKTVYFPKLL